MNRLRRLWIGVQIWALEAELAWCTALDINSPMVRDWEWQLGELQFELMLLERDQ